MKMARSSKGTDARKGGEKGSDARRHSAASGRPGVSVRLGSRLSGLFSAPARIMAPRLLFIGSVVLLCALGLVMVYSASSISAYDEFGNASYYFDRQVLFLAMGTVACIVMALVPYSLWSRPVVFAALWLFACGLLLLTELGGVSALGAERSISIGPFALQPAEFAKIAVLLAIASLFAMYRRGELAPRPMLIACISAAVIPLFLIYRQPDLGTAIILAIGLLVLMVLAGFSWKAVGIIVGLVVVYFVFVCIVQPYHIERIVTMFDPWLDPDGDGYQSVQSQYAFGSGGLFGVGLGLSRQKYLYLPEAHTDFIFAIIGEELGLVGTLLTVALFAVFVFSGLRICRTAPDLFGCMVAGGMTVMIGFQACVNMAQACGIAPVTGKALPFVSYGGSSLIATMIMAGIIVSVSRHSKVGAAHERRRDDLRVLDGGGRTRSSDVPVSQGRSTGRVVSLFGREADARRGQGRQRSRGDTASQRGPAPGAHDSASASGRLDYVSQRGARSYASRSRSPRPPSTSRQPGARGRHEPGTRPERGSSTKPANPSGTKHRRR